MVLEDLKPLLSIGEEDLLGYQTIKVCLHVEYNNIPY